MPQFQLAMIHIGKTGGSSIKRTLEATPNTIKLYEHKMVFSRIVGQDLADRVFFFVREPCSRFVSGFNSRRRKGRPEYDVEWSPAERLAFERFATANDLAEALTSPVTATRDAAHDAMKAILHCRLDYKHFLHSPSFLGRNKHRIAFIGRQEEFDRDLRKLLSIVGLKGVKRVSAHRAPQTDVITLSDLGRLNILAYYEEDIAIYEWCLANRAEINYRNHNAVVRTLMRIFDGS